jgi:quinol monooxygenase YgiN
MGLICIASSLGTQVAGAALAARFRPQILGASRCTGNDAAMIHVIAIITTKPGQRATVLEAFQSNVPNVLAEQGCIEYAATVDAEPPLGVQTEFGAETFVVIEKWESVEALQAHFKAPHMAAYAEKTRELVASRVIHILSPA